MPDAAADVAFCLKHRVVRCPATVSQKTKSTCQMACLLCVWAEAGMRRHAFMWTEAARVRLCHMMARLPGREAAAGADGDSATPFTASAVMRSCMLHWLPC